MTIKNRYPLPRIDNLFDQIKRATMFSKIDLKLGYHQLHIQDANIHKTTFQTFYVHYEFIVVLFGQTNALSIFMCLMNGVFHSYLDKFLLGFLNDILIYSRSHKDHEVYLHLVL